MPVSKLENPILQWIVPEKIRSLEYTKGDNTRDWDYVPLIVVDLSQSDYNRDSFTQFLKLLGDWNPAILYPHVVARRKDKPLWNPYELIDAILFDMGHDPVEVTFDKIHSKYYDKSVAKPNEHSLLLSIAAFIVMHDCIVE